jgi:hypothetical protein
MCKRSTTSLKHDNNHRRIDVDAASSHDGSTDDNDQPVKLPALREIEMATLRQSVAISLFGWFSC